MSHLKELHANNDLQRISIKAFCIRGAGGLGHMKRVQLNIKGFYLKKKGDRLSLFDGLGEGWLEGGRCLFCCLLSMDKTRSPLIIKQEG